MEAFAEVLTEGGRSNSLGRAGEVVHAVFADRDRLDELWACISHDDAYVRMRAIDSFEAPLHNHGFPRHALRAEGGVDRG